MGIKQNIMDELCSQCGRQASGECKSENKAIIRCLVALRDLHQRVEAAAQAQQQVIAQAQAKAVAKTHKDCDCPERCTCGQDPCQCDPVDCDRCG